MAQGYIIVNVYTSRSQIPIEGATVAITQDSTQGADLIGFRLTDQSGKTNTVALETPDIELSLNPSDVQPFSVCNIKISHPSYYTEIIKDVQVFANTTTIQECNLIPLTENVQPQDETNTVQTPTQNL